VISERGRIEKQVLRFTYLICPRKTLHGLPVRILFASDSEQRARIWAKVDDALRLIGAHAPRRLEQIRADLAGVFVCGLPGLQGRFLGSLRLADLSFDYCLASATTVADVASLLVHESQHARLSRLGIRLNESNRHQVERICYRAERLLGRRIPDGEKVVAEATEGMARGPEGYTRKARRSHSIRATQRLPLPSWFLDRVIARMKANVEWDGSE
jgi:hypothetical protein